MSVAIRVDRITASEPVRLRSVRLAAIADSPGSFATSLTAARDRPESAWRALADAAAIGNDQGIWFARDPGTAQVVGMVHAYRTPRGPATMTSLWAAPGFRGVGVADALVDVVITWARQAGAGALRIWMVERNEHARTFYLRLGFAPTGAEVPYEQDPRLSEVELVLQLNQA